MKSIIAPRLASIKLLRRNSRSAFCGAGADEEFRKSRGVSRSRFTAAGNGNQLGGSAFRGRVSPLLITPRSMTYSKSTAARSMPTEFILRRSRLLREKIRAVRPLSSREIEPRG
jgi:hypothetical protein